MPCTHDWISVGIKYDGFFRRISDEADFHQSCLHTISQISDRAKTRWRKTLRRAEKNEVQCFRACVDLILRMRGFLTDGFPHRRSFFSIVFLSIGKNLKHVLVFFTDGKQTDGAHTRSVCPMKTVHRTVYIRRTDRVYSALMASMDTNLQ